MMRSQAWIQGIGKLKLVSVIALSLDRRIIMSNGKDRSSRIDPIFKLKTPILFAHRGGVLEAPESTARAFQYALDVAKADVLELDVQLTRDGQFVVWHGPDLNNVRIEGVSDRPADRDKDHKKIYDFYWAELDGKAWVADPEVKSLDENQIDLSGVPKEDDRRLLLFDVFLKRFSAAPLNIELKESFKRHINEGDRKGLKDNVRAFSDILNADPGNRIKVVVSAIDEYIDEFREQNGKKYPTGLSTKEQLILHTIGIKMKGRAFETTHSRLLTTREIVDRVRKAGGATFVFLTEFGSFLPAIDKKVPSKKDIFEILDRGVDGIMTDRPQSVREIMDRWIASH
jgi:glycerophosphoryl diester phosphodiesterase